MNLSPELLAGLRLLAWLAFELALVVVVAEMLSRLTASAPWRRIVWQGCFSSLMILAVVELSGFGSDLASRLERIFTPVRQKVAFATGSVALPERSGVSVPPSTVVTGSPRMNALRSFPNTGEGTAAVPAFSRREAAWLLTGWGAESTPTPDRLRGFDAAGLIMIWIAGGTCLLARVMMARLICWNLSRQQRCSCPVWTINSLKVLAGKLRIRRRVRLIESGRLRGPVAFGWWRPTIGIPKNWGVDFNQVQREAMLSHELAHLAGRDPLWYFVSDLTAAVFWWHPLIWLARRRLRESSEQAADEASTLVGNGPQALAECLVKLGLYLTQRTGAGAPGIGGNGFRSGLARRVERLCRMPDDSWRPPGSLWTSLARTAAPTILVATIVVGTGWTGSQSINQGNSMKSLRNLWTQSLSALALLAVAEPGLAATGPAPAETEPPAALPSPGVAPGNADPRIAGASRGGGAEKAGKPALTAGPLVYEMNPELTRRYGLLPAEAASANPPPAALPSNSNKSINSVQSKLNQMVFSEVRFESLPLSEVLKFLSDESRQRDRDLIGINFLINPNVGSDPNPAISIDPATGQPVPVAQSEPMDMAGVIVNFNLPLRNVRLTDVLNAIVKVADKPIQFSVEEYGVVFSPVSVRPWFSPTATSSLLSVRTLKVNTNTFLAGLESTFGISTSNPVAASGTTDRSTRSRDLQGALRKLMQQLGVNMDDPLKAVFYNDLTGVLMVRATPGDLELIEAAVETLGGGTTGRSLPGAAGAPGVSDAQTGAVNDRTSEELRRRYGLLPANTANSNNLK